LSATFITTNVARDLACRDFPLDHRDALRPTVHMQLRRFLDSVLLTMALVACTASPQPSPDAHEPQTKPERTQGKETSRLADVESFLAELASLPRANRIRRQSFGTSHEGRDLPMARVARTDIDEASSLRALVLANIHAGEVEGKEAVQVLLREFAHGQHSDVLDRCVLYFVPVYNADGNERVALTNRTEQNGPEAVGERANAQGLDLNRDFVKSEAPETRALLAAMNRIDPHLFFDLHTTDGSWHGYDLTYAPSLSPNCDPQIAALSRTLLDDATAALLAQASPIRTFDYGNFETRDWDGGGAPSSKDGVRGWWTYDHRARYCVNAFGLRNRIGILSEAYSNAPFAERIASTRAFVLACLRAAAQREGQVRSTTREADERLVARREAARFGVDTQFAEPEHIEVLVGDCERIPWPDGRGVRFAAKDGFTRETMPVFRSFASRRNVDLPAAWALPQPPQEVVDALRRHGVQFRILSSPVETTVREFAVAKKRKPKRPFQGHQELVLEGAYNSPEPRTLPQGSLWIDARQPLARLAATLLEPESEDSLSTWNFLEGQTGPCYPVLQVLSQ
jgi:hypothetical protein